MKLLSRYCLALLALTLAGTFPLHAQQQRNPGLLWRISGNGLHQPSYLYGTMHLYDKRVFNFTDSLYAAIAGAQGFAMEVDPDSMMIKFFEKKEEREKEKTVYLKELLKPADFARARKKLQEVFKKAPELITRDEFNDYMDNYSRHVDAKDRMPASMDAWLYSLARSQGKWVGGVEDVADQADMLNDTRLKGDVNEFLNGNKKQQQQLEQMISLYLKDDLMQIWNYIRLQTRLGIDSLNIRRNYKMARRMDSLANIRTMFFAVGTAHLPGEEGVINLLRGKGYLVEPVLSEQRIPAEQYTFTRKHLPWVKVHAFNGLYTAEMPGTPQREEKNEHNALDVRMYADATTNLLFMTMSIVGNKPANRDSAITGALGNLGLTRQGATVKNISQDGIEGVEVLAGGPTLGSRLRIFFNGPLTWLAIVSSETGTNLQSEDADRFFHSFLMHSLAPKTGGQWYTYSNQEHGFALLFPTPLQQEESLTADSSLLTSSYSSLNLDNTANYKCLVQEVRKGYYLTSDTALLNQYPRQIAAGEKMRLIDSRPATVQGYPARFTEFISYNDNDSFYCKVLNIHRGNRIFYLMAIVADQAQHQQEIDSYFNGFSFIPVKESDWTRQSATDSSFHTWAPASLELMTPEGFNAGGQSWQTFDPAAPATFYIKKTSFNPYFWADSDTAFFRARVNEYFTAGRDSLLLYQPVLNGPYKGVEALIRLFDNHNLKKVRLLVAGDTLYEIYGLAASEFLEKEQYRRLFSEFRISAQGLRNTIFTNKRDSLLAALHGKDTARFEQALAALRLLTLTKQDLPWLHQAMLEKYPNNNATTGVNQALFNQVAEQKDPSTAVFIQQVWKELPPEKEFLRYDLLGQLANLKTTESITLLKDLLLQHPPQAGSCWYTFNRLKDSLALVVPVFPQLLPLLRDSLAASGIALLAEELIDSNLVSQKAMLRYKKQFFGKAEALLQELNANREPREWYGVHTLVRLLGKLKDRQANQLLQQFTQQPNIYLKQTAAICLLENDQPVDNQVWLTLAADSSIRLDLYDHLDALQKTDLFPARYYTPEAFGESELIRDNEDYSSITRISFVGERMATLVSQSRKFLLYRVDFVEGDSTVSYLGVVGPYAPGATKPWTELEATGIYWTKTYDARTLDADLDAYLKELMGEEE